MFFSRKSKPEEGQAPDGWPSAAPSIHDQPVDHRPFEVEPPALPPLHDQSFKMDHRTYPSLNGESPDVEKHGYPFHDPQSLGMGDTRSPKRGLFATNHPTHPGPNDQPFEMYDLKYPGHQRGPYREVLPGEVTPYLGLRARLTQVPINRWTVLLLLVLARMLILFGALGTDLVEAKSEALSACNKVEDIGTALVSMPHYFATGINEIVSDGVTDAVRGLVQLLMLILTAFEETIFFVINYYVGTITCLIDAMVHGVLDFAEYAINETVGVINTAVQDAISGLETTAKGVEDAINGFSSALDTLGFDIPSLSGLDDDISGLSSVATINASKIVSEIEVINNDIPSFDALQDIVQEVISVPFDWIKNKLNESYGNWTFDTSEFQVSSGNSMTFCSDNSFLEDFFEALMEIMAKAKTIAIVVLVLLAVFAAVIMAWWEIKRYRKSVQKSQRFLNREPMDVSYIASRPLSASTGIWLANKLSDDPRRQMLIRWAVAYATTYTALFVLSLAIAGAFSCLCEFIVMRAIEKEAPALATEVGNYVGDVVTEMEQASTQWSNASNSKILGLQNDINVDVLSYVVNATSAVNSTLYKLNDEVNSTLTDIFGNTRLEQFFFNIYSCILGDKLEQLDKGINWVHDNAQVAFPLFPSDIFSMGNDNSTISRLLTNSTTTTSDEITVAVDKVISALWTNIVQEGLISLALFLVYIAYVFFGVSQAALRMCFPDKYGTFAGDKSLGRIGM